MRCSVAIVVALILLSGTAAARRDPLFDSHFNDATKLYKAGLYLEAIKEFTEAYHLDRKPALLYNLGRAHQQLGHLPEAKFFYERYAEEKRDPAPREQANLKRYLGEVTALLEKQAEIERQGRLAEIERLRREAEAERLREAEAERLRKEAETAQLHREAEAERLRKEAEIRGRLRRREAETEQLHKETEAERLRRKRRKFRVLSLGIGAGAVVLAGLGLGAQIVREQDVAGYNDDAVCLRDFHSRQYNCGGLLDSAGTAQSLAIAGFAIGGALAITSTVFLIMGASRRGPR